MSEGGGGMVKSAESIASKLTNWGKCVIIDYIKQIGMCSVKYFLEVWFMDFLKIIEKKISRAEDEFVASSNNSLNNCGQLLDYIQALKNIQSMYITEPSVADSNHTDLVNIKDAINNGVSTIVSSLNTINSNISTVNKNLNTINSNISTTNTKLDKLNTVINKLDNLNSTSQLTLDELKNTNDYLKVANDYLKTISEK